MANAATQEIGYFRDHRLIYLDFVGNTTEKKVVANCVADELYGLDIGRYPQSLHLYDAGIGDATVQSNVVSAAHDRYGDTAFFIGGKEFSPHDVPIVLRRMAPFFVEHPETVLVINNLPYMKSPWNAMPPKRSHEAIQVVDVRLEGKTSHRFNLKFDELEDSIADTWQKPAILVVYRDDRAQSLQEKNLLPKDNVFPKEGWMPGGDRSGFDLVIASQPYQLTAKDPEWKAKQIIWPLTKSLRPGGALVGIHSRGGDPGEDIVRTVLPDFMPFRENEALNIMNHVSDLVPAEHTGQFDILAPRLLRYHLRNLKEQNNNGTQPRILDAAWGAAIYVAQVPDELLTGVDKEAYESATKAVLNRHRGHQNDRTGSGLWFDDDVYSVKRRRSPNAPQLAMV